MSSQLKQIYRCCYSTLVLWTIAVLWLFDILRIIFLVGIPLRNVNYTGSLELTTIISLVTSLILVWLLKSEISSKGVCSYTCWGNTYFIPWNEIAEAHTLNYLGLRYYRITSDKGDHIYIARYLSRQNEFEMIVSAITHHENPLRLCIEEQKKSIA